MAGPNGTKANSQTKPKAKIVEKRRQAPGKTLEAREKQLIELSMNEAERIIRSGKATSQLLTHFLKLGSITEELNREKLRKENILLEARASALASEKVIEELYAKAIVAMREYSGHSISKEDDEEDYDD